MMKMLRGYSSGVGEKKRWDHILQTSLDNVWLSVPITKQEAKMSPQKQTNKAISLQPQSWNYASVSQMLHTVHTELRWLAVFAWTVNVRNALR